MAEQDQEFVDYIVKSIVEHPEKVELKRTVDERGVLLELTVDPSDMGKIIGKAGATAKSIRTLLRVLGAKKDARFNLKIVEPDGKVVSEGNDVNETAGEEPAGNSAGNDEADDIKAKAKEGIEDLDDLEI